MVACWSGCGPSCACRSVAVQGCVSEAVCVCVYTPRDVMHLCVSVSWLLVCLTILSPVTLFLLSMLVLPGVLSGE